MADFVAVIRRAVDGLATNTPETRARVYEKARGAVQRQLENMKPRPPEEMLRRQMDKLEAAIASVETEHSEALPAEETTAYEEPQAPAEEYAASQPVSAQEPEAPLPATDPVVEDEAPHAEPSAAADAYENYPQDDEAPVAEQHPEEPWRGETAPPVEQEHENQWPPATAPSGRDEAAESDSYPQDATESVDTAPAVVHDDEPASRFGDWRDDVPADQSGPVAETAEEPAPGSEAAVEHHYADDPVPEAEHHQPAEEPRRELPRYFEPEQAAATHEWQPEQPQADTVGQEQAAIPEQAPAEPWGWQAPGTQPENPDAHNRTAAAWDHIDELTRNLDTGGRGERVEAHFDQEMRASADPVRMPPAGDIPQPAQQADNRVSDDPFEDYVNAQPAAPAPVKPDDRDPWSDLEDLIGYTKEAPASEPKLQAQAVAPDDEFGDLLSPPAKPYRVTPARKRNYAGIILGVLGLLIVGGGAYAVWLNRDSLNDIVGGLLPASVTGEETATQTPPAETTAEQSTPAQSTPPTETGTQDQAATTPAQQTPPPADGASSANKFTQRLMQDGSEADAGPGEAGSLAQNAEGQSVAQLNAPPADPGPAAPPSDGGQAVPAQGATGTPATPSGTPAETPAASGEKMFLYEERIGQSAPTAIEGSVSWSLQREPGPNGGPAEPVIQGRITVPGRGLTALMTVKRNNDSSLPASHLIEIVFAVPPDFEGGAIDSVLRIAMKQTEQDRGNALVAVPAKITDDFHMIALNDFPDARATNLELLRSRDWIDIPVAYRNGRRALFTLQKGADGRQAFEEATREWAQAPANQSGQ